MTRVAVITDIVVAECQFALGLSTRSGVADAPSPLDKRILLAQYDDAKHDGKRKCAP